MNIFSTTINKLFGLLALFLLTLALLSACGGGGGGGGGGTAIGQFIKSVTSTSNGGSELPLVAGETHVQNLYLPTDIQGSGMITELQMLASGAFAASTCPNMTVKLGHTSRTALSTTFDANYEEGKGSLVTVFDNASFTIPATATDEIIRIPLEVPFEYNGVDSLLFEIFQSRACSATVGTQSITVAGARHVSIADVTSLVASGTSSTVNAMSFVFSGGENTQDYGATGGNNYPFNSAPRRTQNLYLASDINGSGPITGIAFQKSNLSVAADYTYSLTLGHSTQTALTTTFADNITGTSTQVANAVTFSVPAGVPTGEWIWVPIPDGSFTYNGTDNLIVDVTTSAGTASNTIRNTDITDRRVFATSDTATAGTVDSVLLHIKLRFNGGPVSVITDGGNNTSLVFNTSPGGKLNLYRASELGTAGTISSVACRSFSASTADSYANFKVIIGHSNVDTLLATAADNFASQTTAVSGAVAVPAGLLAGDWIEVPLTTPFAYDGMSNLAIWMGTTVASGTVGHGCVTSALNPTRYLGQMGNGVPDTGSVGLENKKFDMKLKISK